MAFDDVPGGDPRGPWCPGCGRPIEKDQPTTVVHVDHDPALGGAPSSRPWHAECARPHWDKLTPLLKRLGGWTP
jgi:hypothetical protein